MVKYFTFALSLLFSTVGFTQSTSNQIVQSGRLPIHFGLQVKSILPTKYIQNSATNLGEGGFQTSLKQSSGFGFGGLLRIGLTDMLAIETGINFTQRRYDLNVVVPANNIEGNKSMTFIDYDLPINALIYVPLDDKFFMNASLGVAVNYKPSDTRVRIREQENHFFTLYGVRDNKIGADLTASLGCEYRTRNSGFFYLGASARMPFSPLFQYGAFYDNGNSSAVLEGEVNGSFLTLDFKYFFPIRKKISA